MDPGIVIWLFVVGAGTSATDVFAAAGAFLLHYDGVAWSPVAVPNHIQSFNDPFVSPTVILAGGRTGIGSPTFFGLARSQPW